MAGVFADSRAGNLKTEAITRSGLNVVRVGPRIKLQKVMREVPYPSNG